MELVGGPRFSQPKVPKMEHLDTYLFWGEDGFC